MAVQQQGRSAGIAPADLMQIDVRFDSHSLDIWPAETAAKLRIFIAVELDDVQGNGFQHGRDEWPLRINEQSDAGGERRQPADYFPGRERLNITGAGPVEHEAQGMRARIDRRAGVLTSGNTADFDPCHR